MMEEEITYIFAVLKVVGTIAGTEEEEEVDEATMGGTTATEEADDSTGEFSEVETVGSTVVVVSIVTNKVEVEVSSSEVIELLPMLVDAKICCGRLKVLPIHLCSGHRSRLIIRRNDDAKTRERSSNRSAVRDAVKRLVKARV